MQEKLPICVSIPIYITQTSGETPIVIQSLVKITIVLTNHEVAVTYLVGDKIVKYELVKTYTL